MRNERGVQFRQGHDVGEENRRAELRSAGRGDSAGNGEADKRNGAQTSAEQLMNTREDDG